MTQSLQGVTALMVAARGVLYLTNFAGDNEDKY
jgi:hypothetical protein